MINYKEYNNNLQTNNSERHVYAHINANNRFKLFAFAGCI